MKVQVYLTHKAMGGVSFHSDNHCKCLHEIFETKFLREHWEAKVKKGTVVSDCLSAIYQAGTLSVANNFSRMVMTSKRKDFTALQ